MSIEMDCLCCDPGEKCRGFCIPAKVTKENAAEDLVQKLADHAGLIRWMDAIANTGGHVQTNEATAALLEKAAKVIQLYRARYPT